MTKQQIAVFKRSLKTRLNRVINKAETHCGHQGPLEDFWEEEQGFIDWVIEQVKGDKSV
jgi:hypothetical protein